MIVDWLQKHGIYTGPEIVINSETLVKKSMESLDARKARYEAPTWHKDTFLDKEI